MSGRLLKRELWRIDCEKEKESRRGEKKREGRRREEKEGEGKRRWERRTRTGKRKRSKENG